MNHDEITELLGAYALDAVEDGERAEIAAHLAECARCRAEVAEHLEVASLLAHDGSDAPTGLWSRITESLEDVPPRIRLVPSTVPSAPGRRRWRLAVAAVSAAAAAMIAVLGVQVVRQEDRIDELEAAVADDPLQRTFSSALADADSQILELTSPDGRLRLRGVVGPDGIGYLRADGLPALPDGRTYQLWGAAGGRLVSLGVLGADPGTVTFAGEAYDLFAVTDEARPGVVASTNPPVVAGGAVAS